MAKSLLQKLKDELENIALDVDGAVLIVVGTDPATGERATYSVASFGDLNYEEAAMLLWELEDARIRLLSMGWGESDG